MNVHGNQEGMLECRGRNQGHYPSFCQTPHPSLTHKFTNHMSTLHCVALTMTKVQELYWVPNLRAHIKQVLSTFSLWHWQHRLLYSYPLTIQRGAPHSRLSGFILQGPSNTISEPKQKERPILRCTHTVLHEDYS